MRRITTALSFLTLNVKLENGRGRTDINKDAEDFYCGLLNIVLGKKLENMNLLQMDFPAIDLADRRGKLCVQVTSTKTRDKITRTLDRFYDAELNGKPLTERFNRLIVLIIGEKGNYRKPFDEKNGFKFDKTKDIWDTNELLKQIEGLSVKKLRAVDAYLCENLEYYQPASPGIDLPLQTALVDNDFVGREKELQEIGMRFQKQQFVTLSGLGGIGKTELALRFAREHWAGEAYYVRYMNDWRQTVLAHVAPRIQGLDKDEESPDRIYQAAMQTLRKCSERDLLIVDNADQSRGPEELNRALSSLRMKVLITTRVPDRKAIPVREMKNAELYRIFARHGAKLSKREMDRLIDTVRGHTMTVDLIARTLANNWCMVSVDTICGAMKGDRNGAGTEPSFPTIHTDYPCSPEQRKIYGYLQSLFRLQDLPPEEKRVLTYATLFPVNGIFKDLLVKAIQYEAGEDADVGDLLQKVNEHGWIQIENELVTIHPVIRMVCRNELKLTEEECGGFLEGIYQQYSEIGKEWDKYIQMAEIFEEASNRLKDDLGILAEKAGFLWIAVSEYQKALECLRRAVEKREKSGDDLFALAEAYVNAGSVYHYLGQYEVALEYKQKGLGTYGQVLGSYEQVCSAAIFKDAMDYAHAYAELSCTLGELGRHEEELDFARKAMRLRERIKAQDSVLAASNNDVGNAYGNQGKYDEALKYQQKALQIRKNMLPQDEGDLAASYHDVGVAYGNLEDHPKALENKLRALEIRKKVLRDNDPTLARSYSSVAWTYHDMEQMAEAASHMRQAAEIIGRTSLPDDHPNRVDYPKWASAFEKKAKRNHFLLKKQG